MFLFYDGFDDSTDNASLLRVWDACSTSVVAGQGRYGGNALQSGYIVSGWHTSATKNLKRNILDTDTSFITCPIKVPNYSGSAGHLVFNLFDAGETNLWNVLIRVDGSFVITKQNVAWAVTNPGVLEASAYRVLEMKVRLHPTSGVCELRLDGDPLELTMLPGMSPTNTHPGGALVSRMGLGGFFNVFNTTMELYFDDPIFYDDTPDPVYGDIGTDWLGDLRCQTLFPNGPGASLDFTQTGGGAGHYTAINEVPADGDASYLEGTDVGDEELSEMTDLVGNVSEVVALSVCKTSRKTTGSTRKTKAATRISGVTLLEAEKAASDNYYQDQSIIPINTRTGDPFTPAEINAHQAGVRITV